MAAAMAESLGALGAAGGDGAATLNNAMIVRELVGMGFDEATAQTATLNCAQPTGTLEN